MSIVHLPREVSYDNLLAAVKNAAKEVGWSADVREVYEDRYELGSVRKVRELDYTDIGLYLNGEQKLKLCLNPSLKCSFILYRPSVWLTESRVSEREIERYLGAVSKELKPKPKLKPKIDQGLKNISRFLGRGN